MKEDKNTKILVGGIADSDSVKELLNKLEKTEDKSFDDYIIAYIDFLGVKKIMQNQDKNYDFLQIIQFLLNRTELVADVIHHQNSIKPFEVKIFSDNIVIAQKIEDELLGEQIIGVINIVWSLQFWALVQFGLFLRGGITVGELFINKDIVWGTGLIEAYNMENRLAVFPRVIVSKTVLARYNESSDKTINIEAFVDKDLDGMWFVDYMSACVNLSVMPQVAESLKDTVKSFSEVDDRIKQKINWTIRYFNSHCLKHKDRIEYDKCVIDYI